MDTSTWLNAVFLGVLEGLTEFLPISSTGHLILFVDLVGFQGPPGHVLEVVIQLGAILAVCWIFRARLIDVALNLFRDAGARRFAFAVALAFLPAAVIGAFAHGFIKDVLFNPLVVAIAMVAGGLAIFAVERWKPAPVHTEIERFPLPLALAIGFCQVLAMIPGVSRSGATIMGALMLRVERKTATEFSFFLSIPTMFAATLYDLYKARASLTTDGIEIIAVGFVAAFVSALVVVRWFLRFVSHHDFSPFGWYRIAVGIIMLAILVAR